MDLNAAIKEVVSKILYKNKKKEEPIRHEVYNKQVEKFLNRSFDVESFSFGKVWIIEIPISKEAKEAKEWVSGLEKEVIFNLKYGD